MQCISSPSCSIFPGNSGWFSAQRMLWSLCVRTEEDWEVSAFHAPGPMVTENESIQPFLLQKRRSLLLIHKNTMSPCECEQSHLPLSSGSLDWQRVGLMLTRKAVREVHLLHLSEKGPEGKQRHWNNPSCHRQWHFRNDFICQQTPASLIPQSLVMVYIHHVAPNMKNWRSLINLLKRADLGHCTLFLLWWFYWLAYLFI